MRCAPLTIAAAFLLIGCATSTEPWVTELPPPRVDCATCAASECPDVKTPAPVPTDAQGEADPDAVIDTLLQVPVDTYERCKRCALSHEHCLADYRKAGKIR